MFDCKMRGIKVFTYEIADKDQRKNFVRCIKMKENIHPKYEECVIRCACGETVKTRSTKGSEIKVEICSKCHPFFTGKQKFVDAGGRVDKFKRRLESSKK